MGTYGEFRDDGEEMTIGFELTGNWFYDRCLTSLVKTFHIMLGFSLISSHISMSLKKVQSFCDHLP